MCTHTHPRAQTHTPVLIPFPSLPPRCGQGPRCRRCSGGRHQGGGGTAARRRGLRLTTRCRRPRGALCWAEAAQRGAVARSTPGPAVPASPCGAAPGLGPQGWQRPRPGANPLLLLLVPPTPFPTERLRAAQPRQLHPPEIPGQQVCLQQLQLGRQLRPGEALAHHLLPDESHGADADGCGEESALRGAAPGPPRPPGRAGRAGRRLRIVCFQPPFLLYVI